MKTVLRLTHPHLVVIIDIFLHSILLILFCNLSSNVLDAVDGAAHKGLFSQCEVNVKDALLFVKSLDSTAESCKGDVALQDAKSSEDQKPSIKLEDIDSKLGLIEGENRK